MKGINKHADKVIQKDEREDLKWARSDWHAGI